jgi:hypothetical protein
MGCDKVADELLADPQAMQRLARFPFDVFKVEPENLESRGTAADQERARAQDTGQPRPRSLIAEGMILLA